MAFWLCADLLMLMHMLYVRCAPYGICCNISCHLQLKPLNFLCFRNRQKYTRSNNDSTMWLTQEVLLHCRYFWIAFNINDLLLSQWWLLLKVLQCLPSSPRENIGRHNLCVCVCSILVCLYNICGYIDAVLCKLRLQMHLLLV